MADDKGAKPDAKSQFAKYFALGLVAAVAVITLFVVLRVSFFYSIYLWVLRKADVMFGQNLLVSRLIAILGTCGIILALPSLISFLVWGKNRLQVVIGIAVTATILTIAVAIIGKDQFFIRNPDGREMAQKFYIKTLDGFLFSDRPDIDPRFGIRYKPVTREIATEYYFWQKHGKYEKPPTIQPGKFFDQLTGEPIVWYVIRDDGEIVQFPLPGHDPLTGDQLKPITKQVVYLIKDHEKRKEEKLKHERRTEAEKVLLGHNIKFLPNGDQSLLNLTEQEKNLLVEFDFITMAYSPIDNSVVYVLRQDKRLRVAEKTPIVLTDNAGIQPAEKSPEQSIALEPEKTAEGSLKY